ncbi:MAG: 50S ribosomal protein L1 [Candidatus Cloacimonetes bacterium]|nr:50S ribosomal protein L1 [Candidatus Cloacimonadota bacterium]
MKTRSNRYSKWKDFYDKQQKYGLDEGIEILKKLPSAKFDETVEIHMNTGVDPRKADQQIRNSLILPHGTGKVVRVLVFADGDKATEAKEAGADYVGLDEYIEKITSGWLDFDVAIATPNLMAKIGRLGKILGPRQLMPNPKVGTVTMDVAKAVQDSKGGKVVYKVDKFSNLHVPAGKLSFENEKLRENLLTIISAIAKEKPAAMKGQYLKSITLTSTMKPGIRLNVADTLLLTKK